MRWVICPCPMQQKLVDISPYSLQAICICFQLEKNVAIDVLYIHTQCVLIWVCITS